MSNLGARGGTLVTRAGRWRGDGLRVRFNDAEQRREIVLRAAVQVAKRNGLLRVNWPDVANECRVKTSVITARRCYQSLVALRRAVAERAASTGETDLAAQGKEFGFIE